MYEVWYKEDNISSVVLRSSLEEALQASVKLFLDEDKVFECLVGPNTEILNDMVYVRLESEERARKRRKDMQAGKNWVVALKAAHRDDFWAVLEYAPNQNAANGRAAALISGGVLAERLRVSELALEE